MNKQEIIENASCPEEKILLSQVVEKIERVNRNKQIECTDFLDLVKQELLQRVIMQQKINAACFWGRL